MAPDIKYTTDFSSNNIEDVRRLLDEYGVAVLTNVINEEECIMLEDKAWKELEELMNGRVKKDEKETWKNILDLFPMHSMLIQHHCIGHSDWVWDIRQNKNVVKGFSDLWGCKEKDLLVSFDGVSIHMPPEVTKRGYFRNSWLHTDQSSKKKGHECWQGLINLRDVNEGDATLVVMPKSHKFHEEFFSHFKKDSGGDWYKLDGEDEKAFFVEKGCNEVAIKAPKGALVLWDSRTMHFGKESDKNRPNENHRFVAYVCMTPRSKSTDKMLKKKQEAFNQLRMTTHWPHAPKLFPKQPRTYGKEIQTMNIRKVPPLLTELGRRLAGFE